MMQILSFSAALPQLRLPATEIRSAWKSAPRGLVSKPVCGFDEDAITLGIDAARAACADQETPSAIFLGATTLPYEEKPAVADLAAAVTGQPDVACFEIRGSAQAGLQALWMAALHAQATGQTALAVMADAPLGAEHTALGQACGAGAAAFLVGQTAGCARIEGLQGATSPAFGHRFRKAGAATLSDLELRTDPAGKALDALDLSPAAHLLGVLPPRLEASLAKRLGAEADGLWPRLGDTGAAAAGLALCHWLGTATSGAEALCVATGGGAAALRVTATQDGTGGTRLADMLELDREIDYVTYLKHRRIFTGGTGQ